jgi:hypothetical protein
MHYGPHGDLLQLRIGATEINETWGNRQDRPRNRGWDVNKVDYVPLHYDREGAANRSCIPIKIILRLSQNCYRALIRARGCKFQTWEVARIKNACALRNLRPTQRAQMKLEVKM